MTPAPTPATTVPTVDVTGASGASGPVPRLVTTPPTAVTAAPALVTRADVEGRVGPSGLVELPSVPRPAAVPLPRTLTPLPRSVIAAPRFAVVAPLTPGTEVPVILAPVWGRVG